MDADRRERIVAAAAELFAEYGVINTSRHDIARAAEVSLRSVNAVGDHRVDLLREVLERLPETPVAETMRRQASDPSTPALETLLHAAHDILGDPTRAWDARELEAMVAVPHDEALRGLVGARLERRWQTARDVLRQLRMTGALDDTVDTEAAVLHVLAVGVGLAVLAPLVPAAHDVRAWTALAARLFEAISAADPELAERPRERVWRVRLSIAEGPSAIAHLTRVLSLLDVSLVSLSTASAGRSSGTPWRHWRSARAPRTSQSFNGSWGTHRWRPPVATSMRCARNCSMPSPPTPSPGRESPSPTSGTVL